MIFWYQCLQGKQIFFFVFLGPHMRPYGSSQASVKSELQLPAYTIATAMPDPSCVCNLHLSSQQNQMFNPLSKARDQTHVFMDTSLVHYHWAKTGTPKQIIFVLALLSIMCASQAELKKN